MGCRTKVDLPYDFRIRCSVTYPELLDFQICEECESCTHSAKAPRSKAVVIETDLPLLGHPAGRCSERYVEAPTFKHPEYRLFWPFTVGFGVSIDMCIWEVGGGGGSRISCLGINDPSSLKASFKLLPRHVSARVEGCCKILPHVTLCTVVFVHGHLALHDIV